MSRKKPDLLTQQARLRRKHREKGQVLAIFRKPMRESLTSVLPITAIVLLLCFTVTPVSNNAMMAFLVGSLLLIAGMGLFSLGSEMSMIPWARPWVRKSPAPRRCGSSWPSAS